MRRHPTKIGHPNRTRFLGGRGSGPIQNEVNDIPIVVVRAVSDSGAHLHIDASALPQLSPERGLVGLACLDPTVREFPQTS